MILHVSECKGKKITVKHLFIPVSLNFCSNICTMYMYQLKMYRYFTKHAVPVLKMEWQNCLIKYIKITSSKYFH